MSSKTSRATLVSISKTLSLSPTTVSRALNGKAKQYRISAATVDRIQALAKELEFHPNHFARSLRTRRTSTIGVIVPDISNPFFASITQAITTSAYRSGYSTLLCDTQDSLSLEAESLKLIESRSADGLILCPVGSEGAHIAEYAKRNPATVLVDRNIKGLGVPFVGSDNFGGANDAVQFLIRKGHRRVLCLKGVAGTTPCEERLRGYLAAHNECKVPCDTRLLAGNGFGEQSGYMETKMQLSLNTGFTAVFAMSNMIAVGAIRALTETGLRIPEDVSLIAFDDSPFAPYLATPLTSVAQQNAEIANLAVRLLLQNIEEDIAHQGIEVLLPTKFINRASVREMSSD